MQAFLKGGTLSSGAAADKEEKATTSGAKEKKHVPWVEKFRPRTVDDVAHQEEVVNVLKRSLKNQDLPNLLFYGPPGTGKTSTILAAARELFSGDMFKDRVLELNASDERGINVVREKVKNFAQLTASSTRPDGKRCPPFKIIILDEADSMTSAAQAALRRTMEKESKTTRFCMICNYVSRIIEPLTSRCAKFRFKPLPNSILEGRLKDICEQEKVLYKDGAIEALLETSEGDMRKAITSLQSVARLKGEDEAITQNDVYEVTGVIPQETLNGIVTACQSNSYEKLELTITDLIAEGYSGYQVINQLHDLLVTADFLTDKQKAVVLERLAVVDKRLMDGADEYLQIMDLSTVLMTQLCSSS